jgi:hypothetical protein
MRLPTASSRSACACVIGATLLFPMAAAAEDGPWRWWDGRVKILLRPEGSLKDAAQALRLPERFALVIMGEGGGTEMERTVAALEHFLRKALGRDAAKHGGEVI